MQGNSLPLIFKNRKEIKPMVISAKINKLFNGKIVKAFADVTIDEAIVIHGVTVIETEEGKQISMPRVKWLGKDGNPKHKDVCQTLTESAHEMIEAVVLAAYNDYTNNN